LAYPFSSGARSAGIPSFPSSSSQKVAGFVNGVASVGADGVGYVAVSPCLANDAPSAYATLNGFTGNKIDISSTSLSSPQILIGSLPYTSSSLNNGDAGHAADVRGRIVSCAIRVRYIGPELSRGGRMIGFVSPTHSNLNGQTETQLASRTESIKVPTTREWFEMVMYANNSDEMEYPGQAYNASGASEALRALYPLSDYEYVHSSVSTNGGVPMVIMFTGSPDLKYEFEVITHAEYVGRPTRATSTVSACDINGMSRIQDAAARTTAKRPSSTSRSSGQSMLKEFIGLMASNQDYIASAARTVGNMYAGFNSGARANRMMIGN
jgi:hypothetical protein